MLTPILMYHETAGPDDASDEAVASWTVSAGQFRDHLAALADAGYTGMSVARWLEMRAAPSAMKPVVITFDDGFRGNIGHAVPALAERGWTGTFFVISDKIGVAPYAAAEDWRAAATAGMDIASHTATHPFMGALGAASARRELVDSRAALEDAAGVAVHGFSWPNGDERPDGRRLLVESGYTWSATSRAAFATAAANPYALPRLAVRSWHDADGLIHLIDAGAANRFRLGTTFLIKRAARLVLGRRRYAAVQSNMRQDNAA